MEDKHKHFQTRDQQLAFALVNAGCRLAPQNEGGPAENIYTPADMRSKGMLKAGEASVQEFEEAVTQAAKKKRKGLVTYFIVRDEIFQRAIKAWDKMAEEMQKASADGRSPQIPKISETVAMQVAYMLRVNSAAMKDVPFYRTPILSTMETQDVTEIPVANRTKGVNEANAPGAKVQTKASGHVWTLGLPDEKKRKLGIL